MKKTLITTLLLLTANVTAASPNLSQTNSLFAAIIELQKINYAGPEADRTPNNNQKSNNLNSLTAAALAIHAKNTQSIKVETTSKHNKSVNSKANFPSFYPAILEKHFKTAPVSK